MANQDTKRLCGGTFLVLLLDAKGKRKATKNTGKVGDGRNNPDIFAKLLEITVPGYVRPTGGRTHDTFTTDYKNCRKSDNSSVWLTDNETITFFNQRVRNKYQAVATDFYDFVKYAVDVSTKGKRLVASLLDLIEKDKVISDSAEFFVRPDGTAVRKDKLCNEFEYNLATFILGVWHYIVCNVRNNEVGLDTLNYLLGPKGETHAERTVVADIGLSKMDAISVSFDMPYTKINHNANDTQDERHSSNYARFTSTIPEESKPTKIRISYRGNILTPELEQTFLSWNPTVINLNTEPNAYLLDSNRNAKFVIKNTCRLNFEMAPDFTLQIKVRFTVDDTEFLGFTSSDNWNSQSYVNNLVSVGEYTCFAWFKVLNPTAANPQVQFFMIGEPDE